MDDLIEGLLILNKYYCKVVFFNDMLRVFAIIQDMDEEDMERLGVLGFEFNDGDGSFTFAATDDDSFGDYDTWKLNMN